MCGWSTLTWCLCGGSNLTSFQRRDEVDYSVGMKLVWLCGWSKLSCLLNAGGQSLVFICEHANGLEFCVGGPNWFQCGGSNLTWFQCRMKLIWQLSGLSEIASMQYGGSELIWFESRVDNDLFLTSESKLTGLLCRDIAIDLKLTWFQ